MPSLHEGFGLAWSVPTFDVCGTQGSDSDFLLAVRLDDCLGLWYIIDSY